MYHCTTILTQLLHLTDQLGFKKISAEEQADKRYRHFSARTQLFTMVFAQLTKQNSLRSIEHAISSDNDLYHAGITAKITRTNLAHANEYRPSIIFEKFYFHVLKYYTKLVNKPVNIFGKHTKLIDATTISLNIKQYKWAKFRSTKSGIKIHTRFDYEANCADYLFITNAKEHENNTLKNMHLTKQDIAVFDRGYFNKKQFYEFTKSEISFVTRLKSNVIYTVVDRYAVSGHENDTYKIISDEKITLNVSISKKKESVVTLRKIISKDLQSKKKIVLLTNLFEIDSLEVAELYKKRWTIELFFKMIKQNLKIKKFYGHSENAVKTQIWIAVITHMLFLILQAETNYRQRSFSYFCSEISVVLFLHRSLKKWFCGDHEKPVPKLIHHPNTSELSQKPPS
ncbi:IS4 family transposase [Treponema phagedenis]|uniref:IS4 family transposase n=2 Tax=Treponema phagedenis TaxID=162 RepID=A0A7H8VPJ7_TREPH|nr:IS4 family transposase [Treponema phagedenis]QEJ94269.1 IS4 family transposase [Treponema phagedenis]QEJ94293.1 IS4 family transposase [Treponema phagedenis]QEJ99068.1 IS4 family transposase [Treponema phagedenis]QEK00227.1 IS4 family transposase [Treponema phagedenis]QEK00254.1 IS4 family transposase [Treponema phagedenis]